MRLSSFRTVERLPGARHPAIFAVRFACPCGDDHDTLVAHDDLDWAPIGQTVTASYYNMMTGRLEPAAATLADEAAWRIDRGGWPWVFFCQAEKRPQPAFPSALRLVLPEGIRMVVAVSCPACARTSVNLVSPEHLDVPFYTDDEVEVVERVFEGGEEVRDLAGSLAGGTIESRRRSLA